MAAAAADEKLGTDTVILAMDELLGVIDAFIVTSGRNARQVRTLVEEIEKQVKEQDRPGADSSIGRDCVMPAGSSWTTATSWSMSSWTRSGRSTTSSTCGPAAPRVPWWQDRAAG